MPTVPAVKSGTGHSKVKAIPRLTSARRLDTWEVKRGQTDAGRTLEDRGAKVGQLHERAVKAGRGEELGGKTGEAGRPQTHRRDTISNSLTQTVTVAQYTQDLNSSGQDSSDLWQVSSCSEVTLHAAETEHKASEPSQDPTRKGQTLSELRQLYDKSGAGRSKSGHCLCCPLHPDHARGLLFVDYLYLLRMHKFYVGRFDPDPAGLLCQGQSLFEHGRSFVDAELARHRQQFVKKGKNIQRAHNCASVPRMTDNSSNAPLTKNRPQSTGPMKSPSSKKPPIPKPRKKQRLGVRRSLVSSFGNLFRRRKTSKSSRSSQSVDSSRSHSATQADRSLHTKTSSGKVDRSFAPVLATSAVKLHERSALKTPSGESHKCEVVRTSSEKMWKTPEGTKSSDKMDKTVGVKRSSDRANKTVAVDQSCVAVDQSCVAVDKSCGETEGSLKQKTLAPRHQVNPAMKTSTARSDKSTVAGAENCSALRESSSAGRTEEQASGVCTDQISVSVSATDQYMSPHFMEAAQNFLKYFPPHLQQIAKDIAIRNEVKSATETVQAPVVEANMPDSQHKQTKSSDASMPDRQHKQIKATDPSMPDCQHKQTKATDPSMPDCQHKQTKALDASMPDRQHKQTKATDPSMPEGQHKQIKATDASLPEPQHKQTKTLDASMPDLQPTQTKASDTSLPDPQHTQTKVHQKRPCLEHSIFTKRVPKQTITKLKESGTGIYLGDGIYAVKMSGADHAQDKLKLVSALEKEEEKQEQGEKRGGECHKKLLQAKKESQPAVHKERSTSRERILCAAYSTENTPRRKKLVKRKSGGHRASSQEVLKTRQDLQLGSELVPDGVSLLEQSSSDLPHTGSSVPATHSTNASHPVVVMKSLSSTGSDLYSQPVGVKTLKGSKSEPNKTAEEASSVSAKSKQTSRVPKSQTVSSISKQALTPVNPEQAQTLVSSKQAQTIKSPKQAQNPKSPKQEARPSSPKSVRPVSKSPPPILAVKSTVPALPVVTSVSHVQHWLSASPMSGPKPQGHQSGKAKAMSGLPSPKSVSLTSVSKLSSHSAANSLFPQEDSQTRQTAVSKPPLPKQLQGPLGGDSELPHSERGSEETPLLEKKTVSSAQRSLSPSAYSKTRIPVAKSYTVCAPDTSPRSNMSASPNSLSPLLFSKYPYSFPRSASPTSHVPSCPDSPSVRSRSKSPVLRSLPYDHDMSVEPTKALHHTGHLSKSSSSPSSSSRPGRKAGSPIAQKKTKHLLSADTSSNQLKREKKRQESSNSRIKTSRHSQAKEYGLSQRKVGDVSSRKKRYPGHDSKPRSSATETTSPSRHVMSRSSVTETTSPSCHVVSRSSVTGSTNPSRHVKSSHVKPKFTVTGSTSPSRISNKRQAVLRSSRTGSTRRSHGSSKRAVSDSDSSESDSSPVRHRAKSRSSSTETDSDSISPSPIVYKRVTTLSEDEGPDDQYLFDFFK